MEDTLGANDDPLSLLKSRREACLLAARDPDDPILVSLDAAIADLERGEDLFQHRPG
jgi:hypothetical protein